jgi:microsomal epoxide hydrolase
MPAMPPRPYAINVPQSVLDDLKQRLANTRWPNSLPGVGWDYGADPGYIRQLCDHWRTTYDWRKHEAALNTHPGFLCEIDGLDIHFWHVRGKGPNPLPLVLVHGWPGSIYEFHDLIPKLTDPAAHGGDPADSFDVVVPALPGYGFGGKLKERGWGPSRAAEAFHTLMTRELGYARYGTQGGDWGSIVTTRMAAEHPDAVIGAHINMMVAPPPVEATDPEDVTLKQARDAFVAGETAYSQLHGTKPTSLAIAQADSPAGIAAWIVEKFRTWSDCNGDVESVYTKDQLLTNIMFYWAPNSIAAGANFYYESRRDPGLRSPKKVEVPTANADFPKEIYRARRSWAEQRYNIQRWTEFQKGGHFAALERGDDLLGDVRAFFRGLR